MLILNREDARQVLDIRELKRSLHEGFAMLARGEWQVPLRTAIDMTAHSGIALFMPAYGQGLHAAGMKLVTIMNRNPERGLPLIHSNYLYVSAETGEILSVMDAEYLTAMRTATTSALATELAGRQNCKRLAIFGTGVQARSHVEVFTELFGISEVLVYGLTVELASAFASSLQSQLPVHAQPGRPGDLKTADVICTCTTNATPLFPLSDLGNTVHINAVGAFRPHTREIGADVVADCWVMVDTYEAALAESGEIVMAIHEGVIREDHLKASVAELVAGRRKAPASGRTLFKSLGMALEDLVAAEIIYRNAKARGIGAEVAL